MDIQPAAFKIERNSFLPILKITGMTKAMPEIERVLLSVAIQFIDIAQQSNGKLMEISENENMNDIPNGMTAVRFHIIFRNEEDLEKATSELQKRMG